MYNPRHPGLALFVKPQQLVESPNAMDDHGFPDSFGHSNLGTEGCLLSLYVTALQGVKATFADSPHVGQGGIGTYLFYLLLPMVIDLPGMQADRTCCHVGRHFTGVAVEHEFLGWVGGDSVGVEVEHIGVPFINGTVASFFLWTMRSLPMELFWHRIVAVASPGMATQDALHGEVQAE